MLFWYKIYRSDSQILNNNNFVILKFNWVILKFKVNLVILKLVRLNKVIKMLNQLVESRDIKKKKLWYGLLYLFEVKNN